MAHTVLEQLDQIEANAKAALPALLNADDVQTFRVQYLGRKGLLTGVLKQMGGLSGEERPLVGKRANEVKSLLERELEEVQGRIAADAEAGQLAESIDVTLPGRRSVPLGHSHPIRMAAEEIERVFRELGFSVHEGPEVESDFYNFEALNFPADHPARDMQDTFYIQKDGPARLMRTHTSTVQVRTMMEQQPPVRMIAPGAVFRSDADATHSPMFHQVEGLYVDTGVHFGHLKGLLNLFLTRIFGEGVCTRFRPSFFPFTEPSAEVDIGYIKDDAGTFRVARRGEAVTQWMEIMGCGMVDPAVFRSVGYDPEQVSGFAFGMGVERIAMLKWGIDDIRLLFESDMRFLEQFS